MNNITVDESDRPYGVIKRILDQQANTFSRRWVAYFDVDGTAHVDGVAGTALGKQIYDGLWGLVYITDTEIERIVRLINNGELPIPHAAATNSGTARYYLSSGAQTKQPKEIILEDFIEDIHYRNRLKIDSYFDKETAIGAVLQHMGEFNHEYPFNLRFPSNYSPEDRVKWAEQDEFRAGFLFTIPKNDQDHALLKTFMVKAAVFETHYKIGANPGFYLPNGDREWNFQLLPKSKLCGKDAMVRDMIKELGSPTGLIAGDSENDVDGLFANYGGKVKDLYRLVVGGASLAVLNIVKRHDTAKHNLNTRQLTINDMDGLNVYSESQQWRVGPQSLVFYMRILERAWSFKHPQPPTPTITSLS